MSKLDKLNLSVDNGLAIAEFIQENRSSINSSDGKIGIGTRGSGRESESKENNQKKSVNHNNGQKRKFKSPSKSAKEQSTDSAGADIDPEGTISGVKLNDSIFIGSGNDNAGYVRDITDPTSREQLEDTQNLLNDERRSFLDHGGESKFEESNESFASTAKLNGGTNKEGDNEIDENSSYLNQARKNPSIGETTQAVLDEVIEETNPIPKRRLKSLDNIQAAVNKIPPQSSVIKKTTEENMSSQKLKMGQSSKAGATLNVHQSQCIPGDTHANVENAQSGVNCAMMTTEEIREISNNESTIDNNRILERKLDLILENQDKILKKLDQLAEIKEEVNSIKKTLANQSLALSTVENYIGEMMIIIPKSGNPGDAQSKADQTNPDLRPVIGRDSNRGKKEVTRKLNNNEKIEIGEDFYSIPVAEEKYLPTPINNNENNAANFIPKEDKTSYKIIREIIRKQVSDINNQNEVLKLFDENIGAVPIQQLYDGIKEIIFSDIDYN
ncbi:phosphoprotein [Bat paramyxovirus]|uniref:Phosphoprotein n=1 Tax=bat paramyxovirus 16797 TaxID=3070194 RepID=A0AA48F911_9MONO|nr:phosphoprotein [Bat paramyxovirus]AYM47532.1 phosphoprotein [bat paramyxovirus 16797]